MRSILAFLVLSVFHFTGFAQWSKVAEISLGGIDKYDQDQIGNVYVTTKGGDVKKYSPDGKVLAEYSAVLRGRIQQIDATSQLKVLVFFEDLQEYVILDRYLRSPSQYRLNDFGVGFVSDMVTNFQQNVWIVDQTDFTLKLLDPRRNSVLEKVSLAKVLDQNSSNISSFRVHQNQMYLTDEDQGIFVFDSIGNFIVKMDLINQGEFRFYKDHIYYVQSGELVLKNLYSGELSKIKMPTKESKKVLYIESRMVCFSTDGFVIYKYLSKN